MKKISLLRKKINYIDKNILKLLNKRANIAVEIGKQKIDRLEEVYSPAREKNIIDTLIKSNKGLLDSSDISEIFSTIIHVCRSKQKMLSIAYLGPKATFAHYAALKIFGPKNYFISKDTIADIFYEVEQGEVGYGVVPVENTIEGIVTHTVDMFLECDLYMCGELNLRITHCLLSKEKDIKNIKKIYSHSQAIAQCRKFLTTKFPNVRIIEVSSTAKAAQIVSKEKGSASISSEAAAKVYNLNILFKNIEDLEENYTRFIVLCKKIAQRSGSDKTSIAFAVKDKVGVLHDILVPFKKNNINMTKIESRPSKKRPWEYIFFVDFVGHINDSNVKIAIEQIKEQCIFYKFLGSYPSSR